MVPTPAPFLLEVCVTSPGEAEAAVRAGARRVELCADLDQDGLTPLPSCVRETCRRLHPFGAAVAVMLRPPPPHGPHAFGVSEADAPSLGPTASALLEAGADALVFGFLDPQGAVDWTHVRPILDKVRRAGRESVFHRAVDAARDPDAAASAALEAGFTRLLSGGGAPAAMAGADRLARWHRAASRLGRPGFVLPGGGIRAENIAQLATATGIRQAHGAFRHRHAGIPGALDQELVRMAAARVATDRA